jgi:hypothetical protein
VRSAARSCAGGAVGSRRLATDAMADRYVSPKAAASRARLAATTPCSANASATRARSAWSLPTATATSSGSVVAAISASASRVRRDAGSTRARRGASQGSSAVARPKPP